jgi:hypothetical protein
MAVAEVRQTWCVMAGMHCNPRRSINSATVRCPRQVIDMTCYGRLRSGYVGQGLLLLSYPVYKSSHPSGPKTPGHTGLIVLCADVLALPVPLVKDRLGYLQSACHPVSQPVYPNSPIHHVNGPGSAWRAPWALLVDRGWEHARFGYIP